MMEGLSERFKKNKGDTKNNEETDKRGEEKRFLKRIDHNHLGEKKENEEEEEGE
jgi:hypothetical protein